MWLGGLYTHGSDANTDSDTDNDGQSMIVGSLVDKPNEPKIAFHRLTKWLQNHFNNYKTSVSNIKIGTTYLYLSALKNFRLLITIFAAIFMA